jgi:hypothetical protein
MKEGLYRRIRLRSPHLVFNSPTLFDGYKS